MDVLIPMLGRHSGAGVVGKMKPTKPLPFLLSVPKTTSYYILAEIELLQEIS